MEIEMTAVTKTLVVEAPVGKAFGVFTEGIGTWWPLSTHHIGDAECETAVMEPRAGGRWYERGVDGSECEWGRVLVWEPPTRVVLAWQLTAEWKHDPDFHTEVEVRFTSESPTRTRVEFEHRGLEAFGDKAATITEALNSEGGWSGMLDAFAEVASR